MPGAFMSSFTGPSFRRSPGHDTFRAGGGTLARKLYFPRFIELGNLVNVAQNPVLS